MEGIYTCTEVDLGIVYRLLRVIGEYPGLMFREILEAYEKRYGVYPVSYVVACHLEFARHKGLLRVDDGVYSVTGRGHKYMALYERAVLMLGSREALETDPGVAYVGDEGSQA